MCVESVGGNGLTSIDGLCERLEEITDQCVPSSRPSTSPSVSPSNVPSGMPSKEVSIVLSEEDTHLYSFFTFTVSSLK